MSEHNLDLLPVYIKGLISGKYTLREAAESTGYSIGRLSQIKKSYKQLGVDAFHHGNVGRTPSNITPRKLKEKIVLLYQKEYDQCNFAFFCRCLEEFEGIKINLKTLRKIFKEYGIISPNSHKIPKSKRKAHRPRMRRENFGDLLQMDGTPYQWFLWAGDKEYYCISSAVDDATSKATGMYMTKNECLYGYLAVMRQTIEKYGVFREAYTDRAAIFCVTPKNKKNLTVIEQLQGIHENRTQWQRILSDLNIRQILAWSPQAKGRIERFNETIQGQLPALFKKYKIDTIEKANDFLQNVYIDLYNRMHSVQPADNYNFFIQNTHNLKDVLVCRIPKKSSASATFKFHGYQFTLNSPAPCNRHFDLCITETKIYAQLVDIVNGKRVLLNQYYPVTLCDPITYGRGESMPDVVRKIIYDFLLADAKTVAA